jgi:hypothetical protein
MFQPCYAPVHVLSAALGHAREGEKCRERTNVWSLVSGPEELESLIALEFTGCQGDLEARGKVAMEG